LPSLVDFEVVRYLRHQLTVLACIHKVDLNELVSLEVLIMSLPALGLDIAKRSFHVCLLIEGKLRHKVFPNTEAGFHLLITWLHRHKVSLVHACLEATAGYGDDLAHFLHQAGHPVSLVNPARIKGFAQSQMARNKTDKMDSTLIARFCQSQQPQPWTPPAAEITQLQMLVRRLESLQGMRQQEANRLEHSSKQEILRQSVENVIRLLDSEIEGMRKLISQHIDQNPGLRADRELLLTIPGIGEATVGWLLGEVEVKAYRSARQLAAHAGLTPSHKESGRSVRGRTKLSKSGNARLRRALYMPAIVAKRYNPVIKAFCDRLSKRGKRPMEVIGAAMRKLLHIAFGVLKTGKAFDPSLAS
jgi:transposase